MAAPFTNLTASLWNWEPWLSLEHDTHDLIGRCTKLFWLALYTSFDAKRGVPGLFVGSITGMADAAHMPVDDCMHYLDRLLEHDLVEFDRENRVLRLTKLPGFGDAAGSNGKVIKGWWTQFNRIPECAVRNAHVATLRWMLDEWRRFKGEPLSPDQAKVWAESFAKVSIPPPRKRGVRRLLDADTSTDVQPSLFSKPSASPSEPIDTLSRSSSDDSEAHSGGDFQLSEIRQNDRQTAAYRKGLFNPPDPDPELDQDHGSQRSETGQVVGHLRVYQGGADIDDLIDTLHKATTGWFKRALTTEQRAGLREAIRGAGDEARANGWIAVLGEYVTRGMPLTTRAPMSAIERATHGPAGISCETVSAPGWLPMALQHAFEWKRQVEEQQAIFSQARKELGYE